MSEERPAYEAGVERILLPDWQRLRGLEARVARLEERYVATKSKETVVNEEHAAFEGFAIVELMGHVRLGAYVREATIAGAGLLRIDIPGDTTAGEPDPLMTQYVAPSALYRMTPVTEEIARAVARHNHPEPVHPWELPRAELPAPRALPAHEADDGDYYEDGVGL